MKEKRLGKITSVDFGIGGYQDSMLGLSIILESGCCGTGFDKSFWDKNLIEWSERCKWTEEDRAKAYADIMNYLSDLLDDAKVKSVNDLKGVPVEMTFENNTLKDWRVLTEVI